MQGQILSATGAGNQGVILGEDGARYTFTPQDWRAGSERAVSGMKVEFSGQGSFATDVIVTQGATYPATVQPPPPGASMPSNQAVIPQSPPSGAATPTNPVVIPQPPPAAPMVPVQPAPRNPVRYNQPGRRSQPRENTYTFAVPNAPRERKSKAVVGLLTIFLGPLGALIAHIYIGTKSVWMMIFAVFGAIFPLTYILWPIYIIAGIVCLCVSDKTFDNHVHILREHNGSDKHVKNCLTGECLESMGRSFRFRA